MALVVNAEQSPIPDPAPADKVIVWLSPPSFQRNLGGGRGWPPQTLPLRADMGERKIKKETNKNKERGSRR
jgi:hypothetical protein